MKVIRIGGEDETDSQIFVSHYPSKLHSDLAVFNENLWFLLGEVGEPKYYTTKIEISGVT